MPVCEPGRPRSNLVEKAQPQREGCASHQQLQESKRLKSASRWFAEACAYVLGTGSSRTARVGLDGLSASPKEAS